MHKIHCYFSPVAFFISLSLFQDILNLSVCFFKTERRLFKSRTFLWGLIIFPFVLFPSLNVF